MPRSARPWRKTCAAAGPMSAFCALCVPPPRRWRAIALEDVEMNAKGVTTSTGKLAIMGQPGMAPTGRGYAATTWGAQPSDQKAVWLTVAGDGQVTAFAGKVEYGQGIRTSFVQ